MGPLLDEVLPLLERLVAFDTRNPPRRLGPGGIFGLVAQALGAGFRTTLTDLGDGCVSLLAVRGAPRLLFNVHLDTVPADPAWKGDPLRLVVDGERATGLGAADTKGAAACLLVAASRTAGDAALLFTSDEEAGTSRCVRAFLAGTGAAGEPPPAEAFDGVMVAEPTRCRAVLEHRGIATCSGVFEGLAGHGSSPRALADSALHEAVRWASHALAFAEAAEARRYRDLSGIRFNLGTLAGGTKANVIASRAELRFGTRPLPGQPPDALLAELCALAPPSARVTWTPGFVAPPLPSRAADVEASGALARALALPPGEAVDFWTEAALFSAAGLPALVYGPGDIAQAHTAGEWVALAQLEEAAATYARLLQRP